MAAGGIERRGLLLGAGAALAAPAVVRAQTMVTDFDWSGGVLADTTTGRIRGYPVGAIKVFKGVPYGASTAGANRFMPPVKPQPWTGVRDAILLGNKAPQLHASILIEEQVSSDTSPMSEDCLVLNIWTPAVGPSSGRRPVMVWHHGGGFAAESGGNVRYDGTNLAQKRDVVVVTVNHRLNVFGYLHLADLGDPRFAQSTNVGALDLQAALEWVRDNIANFGGDPGNVTIFGESGGGRKVVTLMTMPGAKGLFHRAISQSGVDLRRTPREDATRAARAFIEACGLQPNQLQQLQELPMQRLLQAMAASRSGAGEGPVVDGRVLPSHPFDPAAPAASADVPWIVGSNETEAVWQRLPLDPIDEAALRARVKQTMQVGDADADALIAVYRRGRPGAPNHFILQVIASDNWLTVNSSVAAERKAAVGRAPAYVYNFRKTTPVRGGKLNSPHTLEITYVFDNVDIATARVMVGDGPERQALADRMSAAWTNFARTGDPNAPGLPRWEPYSAQRRTVMVFDDRPRIELAPHEAERQAILSVRAKQA